MNHNIMTVLVHRVYEKPKIYLVGATSPGEARDQVGYPDNRMIEAIYWNDGGLAWHWNSTSQVEREKSLQKLNRIKSTLKIL